MPATAALDDSNSVSFAGYQIWDEGQYEDFGRFQSSIKWTFVSKWSDRVALRNKLLGGATIANGVAAVFNPFRHPLYPWMSITRAPITGVVGRNGLMIGDGGMVGYDYARFEAEFSSLDPLDTGEEKIDFSARIITVPDGTFFYGTGTNKTALLSAESPGLICPRSTLQRTFNTQPKIDTATIYALLGHVNTNTFLGGAAQTVLYMGACSQRYFTSAGAKVWNITHSFCYEPRGHNKFLIPSSGVTTWQDITDKNGDPPYPLGDFSAFGITS